MTGKLVDYTAVAKRDKLYGNCEVVLAQGMGANFLAIIKGLDGRGPSGRAIYSYELQYRWLSAECEHPEDEAYCCVRGSECQKYSAKELNKLNKGILQGTANLFNYFNLF